MQGKPGGLVRDSIYQRMDAKVHFIVDPETYEVKADGVLCDAPPATSVALGRSQFVF